jgi:hypothetical protein
VLSRLHVTLEILLLAESEMKFSVSSLQPFAAFCLNNIEAWVSKIHHPMRLKTFITVKIQILFLYVMILYSLEGGYQHYEGTCCLHCCCHKLVYFCLAYGGVMLVPTFHTPWCYKPEAHNIVVTGGTA